jgi:pyruvate dehydrogenase E2 component (dihydrolipoamide acetyltransferase)
MPIVPVRMPKWGLSMQEGCVVDWLKREGDDVAEGDELVEIETAKIVNVAESPAAGVLRRIVAQPKDDLPVGALMGVLAEADTPDAEIDAFVTDFQANFVPEVEGEAAGLREETIQAGGRSLRIGRAGGTEGVPAVLIHGYAGDLHSWAFTVEAFGDRPVIAIDLPGHGGSSKDVGDGSLTTLAEAIGAGLDTLGVARAHLVGHSLGAAVVARLAAERPSLAASVTLICPAGLGAGVNEPFLTGVVQARRARDLRPWLEQLTHDPAMVTKDMVEDVLKAKRLDGLEEALGTLRDRMVAGQDFAALRADLARIPAALVIGSREDRIVGAPDLDTLPGGWTTVFVENAGHMSHIEQAAVVNARLKSWTEAAG